MQENPNWAFFNGRCGGPPRGIGAAQCPRCHQYATVLSDGRFVNHGPLSGLCAGIRAPADVCPVSWEFLRQMKIV